MGLESPANRLANGKSEFGRIEIETAINKNRFEITISDDGRGIDWNQIRQVAERRGLPAQSQEDLINALLADGVTTANHVTNFSGRGVGMAAVKSSCENLGGTISVASVPGQSTTFTFSFPIEAMAPEACELLMLNELQQLRALVVGTYLEQPTVTAHSNA